MAVILSKSSNSSAPTSRGTRYFKAVVEVTARRPARQLCVGILKVAHVAEEALVQIAPVIGLDRHLGTLETRMRQDFARIAAGR